MSFRDATRYEHLCTWVIEHPWALTRDWCALIAGILANRIAGDAPDEAGIALAMQAREGRTLPVASGGSVAVIPIKGVIAPRMNLFSNISGGTTFEGLGQEVRAAAADPNIKAIVLDVDSPGGNVAGATIFHHEIMRAKERTPVIGQVQFLGASAAYWALSACSEIVAAPESLVGSIGVYALHDDISKALAQRGITRSVLSAGKFKAEGVDGGPLTDDARAHVQGLIDGAYGRFVGDVARGRKIRPADVRNGFGEGRVIDADQALALGMIDRIATLSDTLARVTAPTVGLARGTASNAPSAATLQDQPPIAAVAPASAPRTVRDPAFLAYERRELALLR